jgi:ketosteroid isomerase-like protein
MPGTKRSSAKRASVKRKSTRAKSAKPAGAKRSGAKHGSDEKAIRDLDTAWSEAAGKMDLKRVVGFYAPDGSVVWPDHPAAHGTAAIRGRWAELFKTTPGLFLKFEPERIVVAADHDLASDFGVVHFGFDTPNGPQRETGKYVVVWRREKGRWKVLYDCYNMNAPQKS